MATVQWTALAELDLEQIAMYLAVELSNPVAAENFLRAIDEKCHLYASQPEMGSKIPELGDDCRVFTYKRWAVLYLPAEFGIRVFGE